MDALIVACMLVDPRAASLYTSDEAVLTSAPVARMAAERGKSILEFPP